MNITPEQKATMDAESRRDLLNSMMLALFVMAVVAGVVANLIGVGA